MNDVFRSPDFPPQSFTDARYRKPLSAHTLYDLTFRTSEHFEGQNGGWAFQFLLLLPIAVLLMPRNAGYAPWAALIISLVFSIATLAPQSNVRYLYPALPLFTLAIAGMAAGLKRATPAAYACIVSSSVVLALLNLYFLPASGWFHQDFFVNSVFDPPDRERYLQAVAPQRKVIDYLNRKHPGEPVLFIDNSGFAGLLGQGYATTWHTYEFATGLWATRTPLECLRYLNRFHLKYVVGPVDPAQVSYAPLRQMLLSFSTREYTNKGWQISRLGDEQAGAEIPPESYQVGVGRYDDVTRQIQYSGGWITDRQFAEAANGTITYSNHPGDTFRLTFNGSRVTWVYTKAVNRGRAEVTIDGARRLNVDLFAPKTEWRKFTAFTQLGSGPHVIEVRVTGTQKIRLLPIAGLTWTS